MMFCPIKKLFYTLCCSTLVICLLSCQEKSETQVVEKIEIPEIRYDNYTQAPYITNIYTELLKKDTTLYNLEQKIDEVLKNNDVAKITFESYDRKSKTYYKETEYLLSLFHDSLLKQEYKAIVQKSLAGYVDKTKELNQIINNNNLKTKKIEDLRAILKLKITLAYLEQYQNNKKPETNLLENTNKKLDSIINEIQKSIPK